MLIPKVHLAVNHRIWLHEIGLWLIYWFDCRQLREQDSIRITGHRVAVAANLPEGAAQENPRQCVGRILSERLSQTIDINIKTPPFGARFPHPLHIPSYNTLSSAIPFSFIFFVPFIFNYVQENAYSCCCI